MRQRHLRARRIGERLGDLKKRLEVLLKRKEAIAEEIAMCETKIGGTDSPDYRVAVLRKERDKLTSRIESLRKIIEIRSRR